MRRDSCFSSASRTPLRPRALFSLPPLPLRYETFSNGHTHVTTSGLPSFMPVRASVAVPDLETVEAWYAQSIPSISWKKKGSTAKGVKNATSTCNTLTTTLGAYTAPDFKIEVRYVANAAAATDGFSVRDFVEYIGKVNANATGVDWGWSAWYDRHLGVMFEDCPLDDYMRVFASHGTSFHPHGRGGTTADSDTARDHCWTEGVAGYGIEMQGNFSYTYKDTYEVFDWCTWDTSPKDGDGSDERKR